MHTACRRRLYLWVECTDFDMRASRAVVQSLERGGEGLESAAGVLVFQSLLSKTTCLLRSHRVFFLQKIEQQKRVEFVTNAFLGRTAAPSM